ncbi:DNA polymerase v [Phlyctema vagabunda]|uniref:DNA polymerase v n=1 Tax=Phlyctema vagabunda TaxID=108571 RepID=A0ABR4P6Y5_9HELO
MGSKRKRTTQDAPEASPVAKKHQKDVKSTPKPDPIDTTPSPFLDNPKGPELKREVELYNLLGSEDTNDRLEAAEAIVIGLLGTENAEEYSGVHESTLQKHLERRLFRGLASGRNASRLGFSYVLAEIIGQLFGKASLMEKHYKSLTFETVLGFLVAKTKPDGDLSGQEEKDHALGLLFGLKSFVQSKILFENNERWTLVLEKLFKLSEKKPWTREECGSVIVEALAQMNQSQAELTLEKLCAAGLALSPEGVGIWIIAKSRFPDMKVPSKPWGHSGNPLQHLKTLAAALKESSSGDSKSDGIQQAKQTGSWNPQLHFVWNIVLAQFAQSAQAKTHGIRTEFQNFWKVAVDENLFSSTASRERKFWGFLLLQKILNEAISYKKLLPSVFSHNLVRCLINSVQEKDRFLNRAADKSLKVLLQAVETNPELLATVLPHLISGHGNYNFDKITKTKTIDKLLALTTDANTEAIIVILKKPILIIESTDLVKDSESRRQMFGDYILNLVRRSNSTDNSEDAPWLKESALPTLFDFAYGNESKCVPELSERTRTLFRNRLTSALAYLLSDLGGFHYPCDLLVSATPDAVVMDENITEEKNASVSTMRKILKKAKKASDKEKAPLHALALLYSLVIFQLYNGESEAVSILEELKLCYDKLIRHKDTEDSDVEASEVLVELLLSFISKPSALLRKVTQHVFSAFMGEMTAGGLALMTDVLESSESLKGQQELFDQEPEDNQDDDIEMEDGEDELDSDVEIQDMKVLNGFLNTSDVEEDDDDDEQDEEDDEEDDADDEEARKLDEALAKALGTKPLDADGNVEEESDDDADMSDSEMMALDAKLVEIFSQRKKQPNKKQEKKDAKETMVNFKSRVLDLLDIYVRKQATNPLAFDLLLPLLQLIRSTKTKQVAEKAHNVILSFAKAAKKEGQTEIDSAEQLQLMKNIHTEASKDLSHMFGKAASTSSLLVASSLYRVNKEDSLEDIATLYKDTEIAWMKKEVKIQSAFFSEWHNWCQSIANA